MTDTAEHPTSPTSATDPPPPPHRDRSQRLYRAVAWVGIVAGGVFIVAVVFFSGFFIGRHSGGPMGHHGMRDAHGINLFHRAEHGPMGPGPWMGPPMPFGPGTPFGPGGAPFGPGGPAGPGGPGNQPPSATTPAPPPGR